MKISLIKIHPTKNIKNIKSIIKYIPLLSKQNSDCFTKTTDAINIGRIKDLGIKHFRLINSNSIRGVTLSNQNPSIIKELKECGIEHIIDLRREANINSKYAKNCLENSINYFAFPLNINMPIFTSAVNSKLSVKERTQSIEDFKKLLPKFFDIMNQGKVYMACLLGLHRTDLAVTLNYLVNPIEPGSPPILSHMFMPEETNFTNKYIGAIKNLTKTLTPKDRLELGLADNFYEIFDARITKLRMMNGNKV